MRALRRFGRALAGIAGLTLLAAAVLLAVPNTDPGRRLLQRGAAWATGGQVIIEGLSGRFPDRLRIAHLTVRDASGPWLAVDALALDWSPRALLARTAHIDRLHADRLAVARLPQSAGADGGGGPAQSLPLRIELDALAIDRVELAAPVAGRPATLALDGRLTLASLQDGAGELTLRDRDGGGTYRLSGRADAASVAALLRASEPAGGLVAGLAGLPDLGALTLDADVAGPWTAVAARLRLGAGAMQAQATGTLDTSGRTASFDLDATAPAMHPRPDIGWQSVALAAHVTGPWLAPAATGRLDIASLTAAGAAADRLSAELSGDASGALSVTAELAGLRIPGPQPALLATAPLRLRADLRLDRPDRPLRLHLAHPLLALDGVLHLGDPRTAALDLILPDIAALGLDLQGHAGLHLDATLGPDTTSLAATGTIAIASGPAPVPALIGSAAAFALEAELHGADVTLRRLRLDAAKLALDASGTLTAGTVAARIGMTLPDLTVLAPTLRGTLTADTRLAGPPDRLTADSTVSGTIATPGFPATPLTAALHLDGLPAAPAGSLTAQATLEGAALTLAARALRAADGALRLTVEHADWKSAHLEATATLPPGATVPQVHVAARMARLDDLRGLTGAALGGSIAAEADIDDQARPRLRIEARNIAGADSIRLQGAGTAEAMALTLDVAGQGATVAAGGTLDLPARRLALARLQAGWKGEQLRLLAPALLSFADGLAVDRLRLGLRGAVLEVAGKLSPALDATASLRQLPAELANIFDPELGATGLLQADARLTGTTARPSGTVRLAGSGLRLTRGPGAAFPPATLAATATLAAGRAQLDARANLGANQITLAGGLPLDPAGSASLHAAGRIDLALLDPLLAADARRMRGQLILDAAIAGRLAAPQVEGTLRLTGGEFQDLAQGVRVHDIAALLRATGDRIRIEQFTGRAGNGSIALAGSIGLAGPLPVDLHLTAAGASPLASELLTAVLDADLTLRGALSGALAAAGTLRLQRADIRVPERLPTSVAVLNVRRPGDRPPPAARPAPAIALDLAIEAPARVFLRGRGIDAELAGSLRIGGTAAAPRPVGNLTLRRGQISVVGTVLTFTSGIVGLDGSGRLDPTLDFKASRGNGGIVATLSVTGTASAPKLTLSSVPELPQDEVLARLLFGTGIAKLGPLQIAQIAAGLAELSGVGGGFQPLESIRKGLGLDRLSVGAGASGGAAGDKTGTLEAGRYVAPGVYLGAKQGLSGSGTRATVQVDLYKGLKLETDVGTSSGSGTGSGGSGGSSVGLTYQFEY